MEQDSTLD